MHTVGFSYDLKYEVRLRFKKGVLRREVFESAKGVLRSFCDKSGIAELGSVSQEGDDLVAEMRIAPHVSVSLVYNKVKAQLTKHLRALYYPDRKIPWKFWAGGHYVRTLGK